jgi:hypothetical protein
MTRVGASLHLLWLAAPAIGGASSHRWRTERCQALLVHVLRRCARGGLRDWDSAVQIELHSDAPSPGLAHQQIGDSEVLRADTHRIEEGDLFGARAARA